MLIATTWNAQDHSVGHPLLDEQHRTLLKICDRLHARVHDDDPAQPGGFHDILRELARYADTHFQTEESLLKQHGYPDLTDQIGEHDEHRARVTELMRAATQGAPERSRVHAYLASWWLGHILNTDMKFRDFLVERLAGDTASA